MNLASYAGYDDFFQDQIDKVQADIQSRVAQFLALKSTLVTLKSSSDPNTSAKAAALYTRQGQLEDLLTRNLDKLKIIQTTGLSLSSMPDIVSIGNFASAMEGQISDVNTLSDASKGVMVKKPSPVGFNLKTAAMITGGLVVGLVVYKAVKK